MIGYCIVIIGVVVVVVVVVVGVVICIGDFIINIFESLRDALRCDEALREVEDNVVNCCSMCCEDWVEWCCHCRRSVVVVVVVVE